MTLNFLFQLRKPGAVADIWQIVGLTAFCATPLVNKYDVKLDEAIVGFLEKKLF